MKKKIKKFIKNLLRKLGFKLIKINFKKPRAYPYTPPTIEGFKCLQKSTGVFHFGAHRGTEAAVYEWFGKKVLWVEALPDIFIELKDNIYKHYQQKAICAVLGDEDKKKLIFIYQLEITLLLQCLILVLKLKIMKFLKIKD